MFYLDVKYLLVVCLCIYYEKVAVKTTLTTMGHFFEKKLNFFPSGIIWNSNYVKGNCFKHTSEFLIHAFCISNTSWREIISPRLDLDDFVETRNLDSVKENLHTNLLRTIISSLASKSYYYIIILVLCYVFPFGAKGFAFPVLR